MLIPQFSQFLVKESQFLEEEKNLQKIINCLILCHEIKAPSEQELKDTGIGRIVNKIQKKVNSQSLTSQNCQELWLVIGKKAKKIVEYWKECCMQSSQ